MARRVAVVDTGTNSTRLLVADFEGDTMKEVARKTQITRLGEEVDSTGRLADKAKERVTACFEGYRKLTAYLEAEDTLLLATSSIRDAVDGEEFIAGLARKAAFEYRILSGEQEAQLSFMGATAGLKSGKRLLVVDVGGGSTELAAGTAGEADAFASLDLGCVRLTEMFLHSDPYDAGELAETRAHIDEALEGVSDLLTGNDGIIAVAGTVTALAALDLRLEEYDRDKVHGHELDDETVAGLLEELSSSTQSERLKHRVLMPGRADVIVAGAMIVHALLSRSGKGSLTVSEKDILDGAALRYRQHAL